MRKGEDQRRAFTYLRLSVDEEDGKAQSIAAQRYALRDYPARHDIEIVEEFSDCGLGGQSDRRPEFNRMIAATTDGSSRVEIVLIYRLARMARNLRIFFNSLDGLADAGVEVVSITGNFGEGCRAKRMGQTISAMVAEQQAIDASTCTSKSRREKARQGFYNGGPIPFGYETYVAHRDGDKNRMKLRIVPGEAPVVREIFDWADMGRGGRWTVRTLKQRGATLRGAKFLNSNLADILARDRYTGTYFDRTVDDDGVVPDPEEWIAVPCPVVIARDQFERVAALRASRNPRRTAPHIAAGTTMLRGIARCGMHLWRNRAVGQGRAISLLRLQRPGEPRTDVRRPKHPPGTAGPDRARIDRTAAARSCSAAGVARRCREPLRPEARTARSEIG